MDDLAWSPFENRLFGVVDDGARLFTLEADRADSLDEAVTRDAPADVTRWVDATAWGDGLAVIAETTSGTYEVLEVGARDLKPTGTLFEPASGTELTGLDSNAASTKLLVTTASGDLLEVTPGTDQEPATLAHGILTAAW